MTLTDFLLVRIAEDEELARACQDEVGSHRAGEDFDDGSGPADLDAFPSYPWGSGEKELGFMAGPGQPARVLAECAAKRRIVEAHHWEEEWENGVRFASDCEDCWQSPPCHTLRALASVYADHPDYRVEWKP